MRSTVVGALSGPTPSHAHVTSAGYRARCEAIEWHGRLWLHLGCDDTLTRSIVAYSTECVEADYYGIDRPSPPDDACDYARFVAYFDRLFRPSAPLGPQSFA